MGGVLDRLAAAETYPELTEVPTRHVFKNFKKVHAAVGTSDLSDEVASFWYLDTEEVLHFVKMMGLYALMYTMNLWVDLGWLMWNFTPNPVVDGGILQGTPAWDLATGQNVADPKLGKVIKRYNNPSLGPVELALSRAHHISIVAGWTTWFLVAISVGIYQYWVANFAEPDLVRRSGDSPWIPRHNHGEGIKKVPIYETKPRAFCFFAPIRSIQDGNCLYAHSELIDDVIFGDTVPEKLKKIRREWKVRLHKWYPSSVSDGFDWALARRALMEDSFGGFSKPRPVPGRYFVDEESSTEDDIAKGKELRRLLWMLLWLPSMVCSMIQLYRLFSLDAPESMLILIPVFLCFSVGISIVWMQFGKWGAKKLEMWDRGRDNSENPFSKQGSRKN